MSPWSRIVHWWSGGDLLMPAMLFVAMILYLRIGERLWSLFGPDSLRRARHAELTALITGDQRGWLARYVALAEACELTRGFALIRACTVALPLLGLLGTVTGMVDTFGVLALGRSSGATTAQAASGGIGLALTATQYGIALAIPGVIAEWILARRVDDLTAHREGLAAGLRAEERI